MTIEQAINDWIKQCATMQTEMRAVAVERVRNNDNWPLFSAANRIESVSDTLKRLKDELPKNTLSSEL